MNTQLCEHTRPSHRNVGSRVGVFGIPPLPAAHTCQPQARPPLRPVRRPECLPRHTASLSGSYWLPESKQPRRCRGSWQQVAAQAKPSPEQSQQQSYSSWHRMLAFAAVLTAGFLTLNRQAHAMARFVPVQMALHHGHADHDTC